MTQTLEERIKEFEGIANCYGGELFNALGIINELQQKNDLLQLDLQAAQEIMICLKKENEKLKSR